MPQKRHPSRYEQNNELRCPTCGLNYLRRIHRRGFLQMRVYSLFGYFPWECPVCREPMLLRVRHQRRSSSLPNIAK
jgi:predicted RNA-binding Zn-ribbon protein involved in translation (DUF1610 family)